jgi:hypothetical protein
MQAPVPTTQPDQLIELSRAIRGSPTRARTASKDRAVIEHGLSDRVANRLEAARLRIIERIAPPAAVVIEREDKN